jgi:hypothetical protein
MRRQNCAQANGNSKDRHRGTTKVSGQVDGQIGQQAASKHPCCRREWQQSKIMEWSEKRKRRTQDNSAIPLKVAACNAILLWVETRREIPTFGSLWPAPSASLERPFWRLRAESARAFCDTDTFAGRTLFLPHRRARRGGAPKLYDRYCLSFILPSAFHTLNMPSHISWMVARPLVGQARAQWPT